MNTIRVLIISVVILTSAFAKAAVQPIDLAVFSQATLLAGNGRYKQAAQQYHRLSQQILAAESKLGTEKMWQYAGLAEALATVCANLDSDAKAYEYWANSVRYLLTGGTDWSEMQQYLHRKNEQANTQLLTQMQTFDVAGGYDQGWEQDAAVLQVWQERLNLFAFTGPKRGLTSTQSQPVSSIPSVPAAVAPNVAPPGQKKLKGIQPEFKQSHGFKPVVTEQGNEALGSSAIDAAKSTANPATPTSQSTSTPSVPPTNRHLINPSAVPAPDDGTLVTPIEAFDYQQMEGGQQMERVGDDVKPPPSSNTAQPQSVPVSGPLQRGNLSTSQEQGVEAIQRRSFVPVPQAPAATENGE